MNPAAEREVVLEARDLTREFDGVRVVDRFSFRLHRGEVLGLLGANGAGKTTSMNMLLGLVTPTSGDIRAFGRDFFKHRVELLKRINFSSAYTSLPGNLLVWQNLSVFGRIYGVRDPKKKTAELLELFEISGLRKNVTGQLSSGESTRLNLCKALLNDPELLLLDEPTASLDPDIADKVRKTIRRVQEERQISILYTSHNMRDIEEVCDRVIFLHKGKVVAEGTPAEIVARSQQTSLEDVFIKIARSGDIEDAPGGNSEDAMNFQVIWALVLRYLFLYTRSPMRLIELVFWPVVDLVVWGSLTVYLQQQSQVLDPDFAKKIMFLIGGLILWDVLFRAQQGVAISFLEDVWTRNLLNVFVAPVRTAEYVAATFAIGFLRICVTVLVLSGLAALAYSFNVFSMKWSLLPFFANLLVFGWSLGMISTALILRWGQAAESLAWAVPFFIQPVVAVFYPVASLPAWVRPITQCFPATHIFEGMRAVLDPKIASVSWSRLACAAGLNVVFMALAAWVFASILRATRRKGLLTKFATQ